MYILNTAVSELKKRAPYYVYVIKCSDSYFYIGVYLKLAKKDEAA